MANNHPSLHKELQERFFAQLAAAGSQAELARRIGIDQGRIAKLVSGKIKFCNLTLEFLYDRFYVFRDSIDTREMKN